MSKRKKSVCQYDWNLQSVIKIIKRAIELKDEFKKDIKNVHVYISPINRKGAPDSVSTIPGNKCPNCKMCLCSCYALRHVLIKPNSMIRTAANTALLEADPDRFFREISGRCKSLDKYRWFVSGDVDSMRTFEGIIWVAEDNPHCQFHLFTKNYKVVNKWLDRGLKLPENIHLRLSEWPQLPIQNPYNLNVCSVFDPDRFFEVHDSEAICSGSCVTCAIHSSGCFDKKIKRVWIAKH